MKKMTLLLCLAFLGTISFQSCILRTTCRCVTADGEVDIDTDSNKIECDEDNEDEQLYGGYCVLE